MNKNIIANMIDDVIGIGIIKTINEENTAYVIKRTDIGKRKLVKTWKHGVHDMFKYITIKNLELKEDYIIVESITEETGFYNNTVRDRDIILYSSIIGISNFR